jgi:hypothetical protein
MLEELSETDVILMMTTHIGSSSSLLLFLKEAVHGSLVVTVVGSCRLCRPKHGLVVVGIRVVLLASLLLLLSLALRLQ